MYKCIIIDDEHKSINSLEKYISTLPNLLISASYTSPKQALEEINKMDEVDLILMDIDMPEISGLDLARAIRTKTRKLIFTTAHAKYAYDAFEAEGDAYLLKPYSLLKFTNVITKFFPAESKHAQKRNSSEFFFVKSKNNHNLINIRFSDIISIESKLNYVEIQTLQHKILTHMTLSEIAAFLNMEGGFLRFQRSFIISERYIQYIDGYTIHMQGGLKVSVGEFYRKDFNEFISGRTIKSAKRYC